MTSNHKPKAQDVEHPTAKQAVVINDSLFPMPRAVMTARDILDQAGIPKECVLQRDYNSPIDHVFGDDETVDLREGNVFKTVHRCTPIPLSDPNAKPKLAFIVNDMWAVTVAAQQTGLSLRHLVDLENDATLFRDYQSPQDEPIGPNTIVRFADGPVFYSCSVAGGHQSEIKIIVNGREKTVPGKRLTYAQVVKLAYNPVDPETIYTVTYKKGPPANPQGSMVEGDIVKLECGMIFNVTATRKS